MDNKPIQLSREQQLELENIQLKLDAIQTKGEQLIRQRVDFLERICKEHEIELNDGWVADVRHGILHKPPPTASA